MDTSQIKMNIKQGDEREEAGKELVPPVGCYITVVVVPGLGATAVKSETLRPVLPSSW